MFSDFDIYTRCLFPMLLFFLLSCTQQKEDFVTENISDYMPLQTGKTFTYRLDSTIFTQSGSRTEIHKYQVKHSIQAETIDNKGQKTFVVQRQINNENATGNWVNNGTYLITAYENKIEVINDNMRVIALQMPLKQGFSWKGNAHLPFEPFINLHDYSLVGYNINSWEFNYKNFGDTTLTQPYNNVWTVEQHNESLNIPVTSANAIGTQEVSTEKYAKGVGLIYKNFELYEYQPGGSTDFPAPHYTGFAIKMWLVSHN